MPGYIDTRFINNNVFTPIKKVTTALTPDKNTAALQSGGSPSRSALLSQNKSLTNNTQVSRSSATALSAPPAKNLNIPRELIYPSYLKDEKYLNRPVIEFCCLDARPQFGIDANTTIYLPAPALSINNNSMYDDTPLGIMGAAAMETMDSIQQSDSASGFIDSLKNKGNEAFNKAKNSLDLKTGALFGLSRALEEVPGAKEVAAGAKIASRATVNKHVVTEFTATATREFELQFKFIPDSQSEAITINNIVKLFKISVYPAVSNLLLLEYPPRWSVKFLKSITSNEELESLSKIFNCYLLSCNISYNGENNAFFEDGNPLETNISLTLKETRALNANDISNL